MWGGMPKLWLDKQELKTYLETQQTLECQDLHH